MNIKGETAEVVAFFDWIRLRPKIAPFVFHVANERKCSIQYGRLLKRMGVKAGVSDVIIAIPSNEFHGLFIEMKHGKNKATSAQLEFLANMKEKGYATAICYGATKAIKTLEDYLSV